jgi:isoamylase/glycogen operon protein
VLGAYSTGEILEEISLADPGHRSGDIVHIAVRAHEEKIRWGWRLKTKSHFKKSAPLIVDPYAKLLWTGNEWGKNGWEDALSGHGALLSAATHHTAFPWKEKNFAPLRPKDLIIYEAHVRGFTKDPSSGSPFPGTYLAMADKISHLKDLGMTALELMPIFEFDERDWKKKNPIDGSQLCDYWGYSPLNYFSPMNRYGTTPDPLHISIELKELVESCHDHGIAVILDVVYNHTGEGDARGPAYSLKQLAEDTYYIKNQERFENYTGCGNTLNVNHPIVSDLILDSLRHAVLEYHIDGFRFDLASVLSRDQLGAPMTAPFVLEAIVRDPIVGKCILITEPWDAVGLYQTGTLFQLNQCHLPLFCEWNDKFRDDVRKFFKGAPHSLPSFATRLAGSQDLYGGGGSPKNSINFITSHDGFTLYDLVSYNMKHNEANGEQNRDGMNENYSWNCGVEGLTKSRVVLRLRDKQMKNLLIALFLSQGSIQFSMGDECKSTRDGNNNSWCQDTALSWLRWDEIEKDTSLKNAIRILLEVRAHSGCFGKNVFLTPEDIDWHGLKLLEPSWNGGYISFSLKDTSGKPILFVGFNATSLERTMQVPEGAWSIIADTSKAHPNDFFSPSTAPDLMKSTITLSKFSSIVLLTKNQALVHREV